MRELELLAPARNADIGIAAIDCGADAVYIAGPGFGARQGAGNSMDEVRRLCGYAHKFGVRIFLTLNTILFDDELPAAEELLKEAAEAGVDAVIAQDLAVFKALHCLGNIPLPIHASTQCAIRTPEQARFYESLGAARLVLERQLSLEQVRAIREAVNSELEFFVHGALCVCYSGQCYMSEAVAGRSANRGACVQACRSRYDLVDSEGKVLVKDKALLSLKDLNLIERLQDLAEAGVSSFKIEGRLKGMSYVRNVVKAYSEALDRLVAARPGDYRRASFGRSEGGFTPNLGKTFNRGYTELFMDGKRSQWSSMDAPKSIGERIGTVVSRSPSKVDGQPTLVGKGPLAPYASRPSRANGRPGALPTSSTNLFEGQSGMRIGIRTDDPKIELHNGDGFCFISKDHNGIVGFRGDVCQRAGKDGWTITTKEVHDLYPGAVLHRNLDMAFEKETEANLPARRIPVDVNIKIEEASICVLAESQDGRRARLEVPTGGETARNTERMRSLFEAQVGKNTGIYSFRLRDLESALEGGVLPLMSASALNGIRRELAAILDGMPCKAIPLPAGKGTRSGSGAEEVTYKSNVSNRVSEGIYRERGAMAVEEAFELSHREGAELMRTKYCIRAELDLCPSKRPLEQSNSLGHPSVPSTSSRTGLYLVNNGKRYRLGFDCAACEMTVAEANP